MNGNSEDNTNKDKVAGIQAEIVDASDESIKKCGEYIRSGGIVGMPTETVYGLAANAFDIEAVKKIFEYKGRPLSDPLIVHVTSTEMAKDLIDVDDDTMRIFELLARNYWPGPLTVVVRANFNKISPTLTANTDFIGIRYPNHPIAKKLIEFSGVPIAAPSANKFCHISPVNPVHVFEDFKEFPVKILNGGVCNFCMESSVVKIVSLDKRLEILRMGAISPENFSESFSKNEYSDYKVQILSKAVKIDENVSSKDNKLDTDGESIKLEAPGQFIKHYSPSIDTYIVTDINEGKVLTFKNQYDKAVIIDYNSTLRHKYKERFTNYIELSETGDPVQVMHNLYNELHNAENVTGAEIILLCDLGQHMPENEHKSTLVDRILKAAAHKRICINI